MITKHALEVAIDTLKITGDRESTSQRLEAPMFSTKSMTRPKVLVTRRLPAPGMRLLEEHADIEVHEGEVPMSRLELVEHLRDKQGVLCTLADVIDKEVIASAPQLKVISNYAVGVNNIDIDAATSRGIDVTNTPGVLTEATADLTWALLLSTARRIPESDRFVREGKFVGWGPNLILGSDVSGRTLGIIGLGDIGTAVARRARGFGMTILYHNRRPSPRAQEVEAQFVSLDELLSRSDFVTVHVPLNEGTRHMLGARELALMKRTAILINTSRGPVIDEAALVDALRNGRLAGAGLDVFEQEPALTDGLSTLHNVVLTPHIGSGTHGTRERMAVMAAEDLLAVLDGRCPPHLVNPLVWR